MDVVLQLVIFLVGRIAIFGQFHQQLRRALVMLWSGASVLVHQCSLDQLAQIRFTVHQLLQQRHKGSNTDSAVRHREASPVSRWINTFIWSVYSGKFRQNHSMMSLVMVNSPR